MKKMIFVMGMVLALLSGCDNGLGSPGGAINGGDNGSDGKSVGFGEIRIGPGGPVQSLTAVPTSPGELETMTYDVVLERAGYTPINESFGPDGGSITIAAGAWRITVKARYTAPNAAPGTPSRLRGFVERPLTIEAGKSYVIKLKTCIGISTAAELKDILNPAGNGTLSTLYPPDTTSGAGDLIVLENKSISINEGNITASLAATGILSIGEVTTGVPRHVTIIAEPGTTQTLTSAAFTVEDGASLTLGKTEYTGKLVFDGGGIDYGDLNGGYGAFALYVTGGSSLTINGTTEITNCENSNGQGGAITVKDGSSLTLNSGDIHDNHNTEPAITTTPDTSNGGAIFVEDSTFVMNDGIIQNNSAINRGGGVYIAATSGQARFTMNGGTIYNNSVGNGTTGTTVAQGGGVWHSGEFIMKSGATISNNVASDSAAPVSGGGIYQEYQAPNSYSNRFTMDGGTVTGNSASYTGTSTGIVARGGGIMGSSGSSNMNLTGGTISSNTASASSGTTQGGGIYCAGILTSGTTPTNTIGAVIINGNTASTGGGVYSSTANLDFNGTTISNNNANDSTGTGIGGAYRLDGFGEFPLNSFLNVTFDKNMVQGGFSIDPAPNAGYDYNQESGFTFDWEA
ncbi:hypothetical protein AGMMS49928_10540 [Spirochaetia bacterium]|nr:hypothetical protein AGMMS49928_10540 [Spirochaetia bacterium]